MERDWRPLEFGLNVNLGRSGIADRLMHSHMTEGFLPLAARIRDSRTRASLFVGNTSRAQRSTFGITVSASMAMYRAIIRILYSYLTWERTYMRQIRRLAQ